MRPQARLLPPFLALLALPLTACTAPSKTSSAIVPPNYSSIIATSTPDQVIGVTHAFNIAPADILRIIPELFPVTVAFEPDAYHVILRGRPEDVKAASAVINHMESAHIEPDPACIFTIHLQFAKAREIAATLQEMNAQGFLAGGTRPMAAIPDDRTNKLIISSDIVYSDSIRSIIEYLDAIQNPSPKPAVEIRIQNGQLVPKQ